MFIKKSKEFSHKGLIFLYLLRSNKHASKPKLGSNGPASQQSELGVATCGRGLCFLFHFGPYPPAPLTKVTSQGPGDICVRYGSY